ncbi:uncharacterized protein METZ01_LOCUS156126 [marine metagenome]|uniref:Lcl C-terminal domain-containing protein n=1 Tax=marine metagenome TaxID=408172 RepID=A0A382AQA2_9ZZZZ
MILVFSLPCAGIAEETYDWSVDKRFKDNGDETITDTKTGLIWMKKDSYLHSGHWINWFESVQFIKNVNEEGFANQYDWQLPTVEQLTTLYETDKINSKVLGSGMNIHIDPIFAKEGSASLWSSEENGNYNAFGVVFNTGKRFNSSKKSKFRKATRAVRYLN